MLVSQKQKDFIVDVIKLLLAGHIAAIAAGKLSDSQMLHFTIYVIDFALLVSLGLFIQK